MQFHYTTGMWDGETVSMVTYKAFFIGVVHAGETHKGNTSHAAQERNNMSRLIQILKDYFKVYMIFKFNSCFV